MIITLLGVFMQGIKINEKLIKYNFSSRGGEKIKYIVIHDTGNKRSGADAEAHFNFFNNGDRQASAHYFVDDKQILRVVKDSDKSWHCGDGRGLNGITNDNSIGIEMCINSDGDFNKTYLHTLKLTKYLMKKYNIPLENVVRHYDASRKICPNIWKENNWAKWEKFKQDLKQIDKEQKDYTNTITQLYKNIFQREPDSEGLNYWNEQLNLGLTYGDMLKAMGESVEFRHRYIS